MMVEIDNDFNQESKPHGFPHRDGLPIIQGPQVYQFKDCLVPPSWQFIFILFILGNHPVFQVHDVNITDVLLFVVQISEM